MLPAARAKEAMSERNFFAELKRRNVYKVAVAYAVVAWLVEVNAETSASLAGRSNEELLAIIRGGETGRDQKFEIKPLVLPANFWTMPPRDAALALVLENSSEETKQRVRFSIADPPKGQPPDNGEVGIRWDAPGSGPMAGGVKVLRAAGEKSHLAFSAVELAGEATKKEIKAAIDRTKTVPLAADVALHAFQVIWWLGRVQQTGEPGTRSVFVTHQTSGTFWIRPGLRPQRDVTVLDWQLDAETGEEFDVERHAGFAWFLISEAAKQQPEDITATTAILGEGVYPDEALKFLRTQPRPRNDGETEAWVNRTLKILRAYRRWRWFAINNLVPWHDPMRYRDARIDAALRAIAAEKLGKGAGALKDSDEGSSESVHAAEHLAWRDSTDIFPALLAALVTGDDRRYADDLLTAAAFLGSRHAELRKPILEYLDKQLADIARSKHGSWKLFDIAWRYEFRELRPALEKLTTANANEMEDALGTSQISPPPPPPTTRRFHAARKILLTWSEPDPLTKLKLDALVEASSTAGFQPAEHIRREFEQLGEPERQAFREFGQWMKKQKLPYNWSPQRVDWAISPEALAAAE
jgi:hypothetical protein